MVTKNRKRFCTQCGGALPSDAAFCPTCGRPAAGKATTKPNRSTTLAAPASSGPPPANRSMAMAVLAGIAAIGIVAVFYAGRQDRKPRAVSGSPTVAASSDANVDPRHAGLPPEIKEKIDAALTELTQKAEAEPESIEAWRNLARARSRATQFDASYTSGAEEALGKLLALAPDDPEAIRMYGNLEYVRGDFSAAETYYRRYLKVRPDDPNVETDFGSVTMFQGKREEAQAIFGKVLAKHPDFMQAHFHLGVALHTSGDREHAISHLKQAMELADDDDRERIRPYLEAAESGSPHGQFVPPRSGKAGSLVSAGAKAATSSADGVALGPTVVVRASSNASNDFQRRVDALLLEHRIVGPKIASIRWSGDVEAQVALNQFPMDKMPAVMRNKFKSTINERIAEIATDTGTDLPVNVELLDGASGHVMDRFDGKEWVGAFDEQNDG